jgi:hypothetical protein
MLLHGAQGDEEGVGDHLIVWPSRTSRRTSSSRGSVAPRADGSPCGSDGFRGCDPEVLRRARAYPRFPPLARARRSSGSSSASSSRNGCTIPSGSARSIARSSDAIGESRVGIGDAESIPNEGTKNQRFDRQNSMPPADSGCGNGVQDIIHSGCAGFIRRCRGNEDPWPT